ncbi:MAG TPA: NAD(P)H-hydrate dehydratase [Pseudobdellovibrionaceae bacterium]|nr:NAD(P)H-hydrate dehydratase [Pseudobdellovibrionaceae bacterium]
MKKKSPVGMPIPHDYLVNADQTRLIDKTYMDLFRVDSKDLINRAGHSMSQWLHQHLPSLNLAQVVILAGPGNNGADAVQIAKRLHGQGCRVIIVHSGRIDLSNISSRGAHQIEVFTADHFAQVRKQLGRVVRRNLSWQSRFAEKNSQAVREKILERRRILVIDGIFGVGISRPIDGTWAQIIHFFNQIDCLRISVDLPSGLDCDRGVIRGICFDAHLTLSVLPRKYGCYLNEGIYYSGQIIPIDIGFPQELIEKFSRGRIFNSRWAKKILPYRDPRTNKTQAGRVYIIGGSPGMEGAALLVARGAFYAGAGYVTWVVKNEYKQNLAHHLYGLPQLMTISAEKFLTQVSSHREADSLSRVSVVFGPGLGEQNMDSFSKDILMTLGNMKLKNVVIDADGLRIPELQKTAIPQSWVLTPHAGEASCLIPKTSKQIEVDRVQSVLDLVEKYNCVCLLKGLRTLVASGSDLRLINSGNAALAKAGSGDFLSGMIAALMAQNYQSLDAASLGAFLHGKLADNYVRKNHGANWGFLLP